MRYDESAQAKAEEEQRSKTQKKEGRFDPAATIDGNYICIYISLYASLSSTS